MTPRHLVGIDTGGTFTDLVDGAFALIKIVVPRFVAAA